MRCYLQRLLLLALFRFGSLAAPAAAAMPRLADLLSCRRRRPSAVACSSHGCSCWSSCPSVCPPAVVAVAAADLPSLSSLLAGGCDAGRGAHERSLGGGGRGGSRGGQRQPGTRKSRVCCRSGLAWPRGWEGGAPAASAPLPLASLDAALQWAGGRWPPVPCPSARALTPVLLFLPCFPSCSTGQLPLFSLGTGAGVEEPAADAAAAAAVEAAGAAAAAARRERKPAPKLTPKPKFAAGAVAALPSAETVARNFDRNRPFAPPHNTKFPPRGLPKAPPLLRRGCPARFTVKSAKYGTKGATTPPRVPWGWCSGGSGGSHSAAATAPRRSACMIHAAPCRARPPPPPPPPTTPCRRRQGQRRSCAEEGHRRRRPALPLLPCGTVPANQQPRTHQACGDG